MKKQIIPIVLLIVFCIGLVNAADGAFTFKIGETKNVTLHVINTDNSPTTAATSCYLTVKDPKLAILVNYQQMGFIGNGDFTYLVNGTLLDKVGEYPATLDCNDGTDYLSSSFIFEVTPSGMGRLTDGEGNTYIGAIIVMIVITLFLFVLGYKAENLAGKIIMIGTAGVLLIATLLFSLVGLTQLLGGFDAIIEGYSTFWFVVKVIASISITALVLFGLYLSYRVWLYKRGFID